jgi:hypothetical protein
MIVTKPTRERRAQGTFYLCVKMRSVHEPVTKQASQTYSWRSMTPRNRKVWGFRRALIAIRIGHPKIWPIAGAGTEQTAFVANPTHRGGPKTVIAGTHRQFQERPGDPRSPV